jgi:cysteine synthase B
MPGVSSPPRAVRGRSIAALSEAVGRTPLLRLRAIEHSEALGEGIELYAKLELCNPGGSVKDRAALRIFQDAISTGRLKPGLRLLDSTSGNTGVAYSWIGAALDVPVTLVMPENVSTPRKRIAEAFGTEIIYSDPLEGSDGAIRLAQKLAAEQPNRYCYVDQYSNPNNPLAHEAGTAAEIWGATEGRVTHFVAGVGTTGTLVGTSRGLKREKPSVRIYGVQPTESFHGLEGLKHLETSIVPAIFQASAADEMLFIETDEGWNLSERLGREEGALVGHSSGAALAGALRVARSLRDRGERGVVVTVFPDKAERYLEPPHVPKGK